MAPETDEDADVMLIDAFARRCGGIDAAKAVLIQEPPFAVAVFTQADDLRLLLQVLRMGARGYLLKSAAPGELVDALKRLAAGETVIAPRLATEAALLAAREIDIGEWAGAHLGLTRREAELLTLLGQGLSPQQAVDEMQLSWHTIRTHSRNLGGLNWSSQHLNDGGVRCGDDEGTAAGGAAVSGSDSVAGTADGGMAGGSGPVLGCDRSRRDDRGSGSRGGRVIPRRVQVVPPRWRREPLPSSGRVGSLPVVLRARGDRVVPGPGRRCPRDRPTAGPFALDDLAGVAPQRIDSDLSPRVQGDDRPVARRAPRSATQGRQACHQRPAPCLRTGTALGRGPGS